MTLGTPAKLNAATLLRLAERATRLSAGQWSLALLQAAFPQAVREDLLDLPVGIRDRLIMAVRARLVAMEFRRGRQAALFAATPPLPGGPTKLRNSPATN